jgi:hypothetical protein
MSSCTDRFRSQARSHSPHSPLFSSNRIASVRLKRAHPHGRASIHPYRSGTLDTRDNPELFFGSKIERLRCSPQSRSDHRFLAYPMTTCGNLHIVGIVADGVHSRAFHLLCSCYVPRAVIFRFFSAVLLPLFLGAFFVSFIDVAVLLFLLFLLQVTGVHIVL